MTEVIPDEFAANRGADARTAAVEKDVVRVEIRVTALELWKGTVEVESAARKERDIAVKDKLDRIDGTLTWLNRIVIGAVLTAVVLFILKGGLSLPNI